MKVKPEIRIKRIHNDLLAIQNSACQITKKDDYNWLCELSLTSQCPYYGQKIQINIEFGENYPLQAPKLTIIQPQRYFHPNIASSGRICNKTLDDQSITLDLKERIEAAINLFYNPNPESSYNGEATSLYKNQFHKYYKKAFLKFRKVKYLEK